MEYKGNIKILIDSFWKLSEKPVKFNKDTKYTLKLETFLSNFDNESSIELLCLNSRRIRMESVGLFEEIKEKYKDEIEEYLVHIYDRKSKIYNNKRKKYCEGREYMIKRVKQLMGIVLASTMVVSGNAVVPNICAYAEEENAYIQETVDQCHQIMQDLSCNLIEAYKELME